MEDGAEDHPEDDSHFHRRLTAVAVRQTTRRRLKVFVSALIVCAVVGASSYFIRGRQLDRQLLVDRSEGMGRLKDGDHFNALHKIGRYLQKHPTDVEAMF